MRNNSALKFAQAGQNCFPFFRGKRGTREKKRTWRRGKRRLWEPLPESIIEQSFTESGGCDDLGQPPFRRVPDSVRRSIVRSHLRPPLLKLASSSSYSNFRGAFARRRHQSYWREKVVGKVFGERESRRKGICRERQLSKIKCKCLKL